MRENFAKALPIEMAYEGGFANNPRDPGGRTLEGVIQRVYDGYRDRVGRPRRQLSPSMRGTVDWIEERNAIYRAQYWDAVRGDALPAGIDLVMFDGAINSGPYQAAKWLQRSLGMHDVDGHLGEATLAAVAAHPDHDALIAEVLSRRLAMLQHLDTWSTFGKGWAARVANVKRIGQAWATGSVGPAPVEAHADGGSAKAYASSIAQPAMDAESATKLGVGAGGLSGLLQGAQSQLEPFIGTSDLVQKLYLGIVVAGVAVTIGGLAYGWWSSRKSKRAQAAIDGELTAEVPEAVPA